MPTAIEMCIKGNIYSIVDCQKTKIAIQYTGGGCDEEIPCLNRGV